MSPVSLQTDHLSFSAGGKTILEDLTLSFEPGKLYGILGPNGSGKTTLLRHLCGIQRAPDRSVLLDGKTPLAAVSAKALAKRISFLPQHRSIPDIPVETLVGHGRFPHLGFSRTLSAEDHAIVHEAMAAAGVLDLSSRSLPTLSGGERQRVYIAMLLAQNTDIVLLDEPTTYLDAKYKFEVMRQLSAMRDHGKTVIAVLHDLPLALSVCDRLVLLQHGQCMAADTPQAVYRSGVLDRVFGIRLHCAELDGTAVYAELSAE